MLLRNNYINNVIKSRQCKNENSFEYPDLGWVELKAIFNRDSIWPSNDLLTIEVKWVKMTQNDLKWPKGHWEILPLGWNICRFATLCFQFVSQEDMTSWWHHGKEVYRLRSVRGWKHSRDDSFESFYNLRAQEYKITKIPQSLLKIFKNHPIKTRHS